MELAIRVARRRSAVGLVLLAGAALAGCPDVNKDNVTIVNLPECISRVRVHVEQSSPAPGGTVSRSDDYDDTAVEGSSARFEELGKRLEDGGYDLSRALAVTVTLYFDVERCPGVSSPQSVSGDIRFTATGSSQLDYNDL